MIQCSLFVVKLGGALLDDSAALSATIDSICALHTARPGSVIVVHGGGSSVDRHLARLGMPTEKRDGIRLTPPDQMIEISAVLSGRVNATIVAELLARGSSAVGLSLADGFLTSSITTTRYPFNPGRVGEVVGGDAKLVHTLLHAGFLPIISSVAVDAGGDLLNVNADDAAAAIARIVGATRLIFLTDVFGVLDQDGALISQITASEVATLIEQGVIYGGMIPKINNALATATETGICVVIAGWRDKNILARLADGESVGSTIVPPSFASLHTTQSTLSR
jgi:acetylglutamate kinase